MTALCSLGITLGVIGFADDPNDGPALALASAFFAYAGVPLAIRAPFVLGRAFRDAVVAERERLSKETTSAVPCCIVGHAYARAEPNFARLIFGGGIYRGLAAALGIDHRDVPETLVATIRPITVVNDETRVGRDARARRLSNMGA